MAFKLNLIVVPIAFPNHESDFTFGMWKEKSPVLLPGRKKIFKEKRIFEKREKKIVEKCF